jgi:hypothetical protein
MALEVEGIVDGSMNAQKALRRRRCAAAFAFTRSGLRCERSGHLCARRSQWIREGCTKSG